MHRDVTQLSHSILCCNSGALSPSPFPSYVYSPYQYFKKLNIPGPPPKPVDGNTSEFLKSVCYPLTVTSFSNAMIVSA